MSKVAHSHRGCWSVLVTSFWCFFLAFCCWALSQRCRRMLKLYKSIVAIYNLILHSRNWWQFTQITSFLAMYSLMHSLPLEIIQLINILNFEEFLRTEPPACSVWWLQEDSLMSRLLCCKLRRLCTLACYLIGPVANVKEHDCAKPSHPHGQNTSEKIYALEQLYVKRLVQKKKDMWAGNSSDSR